MIYSIKKINENSFKKNIKFIRKIFINLFPLYLARLMYRFSKDVINKKTIKKKAPLMVRRLRDSNHFKSRVVERFGIILDNKDIENICSKVLNGEPYAKMNKKELHHIRIKNCNMFVVYCSKSKFIKTAITKSMINKYWKK